MARPKKNNADYFPHDSGMRNDPRVKAVRRKFGLEGYSVWLMLLESLTDSDFFELKLDQISIEIMSGDFEIGPEKLREIIDYLLLIELLQTDSEKQTIFSNRHKANFSALLSKRERDRGMVIASENPQTASENPQTASENPQSKEKESIYNTPLPPKGKDVELKDFLLKNIPDDLSFLKNNLLEFFKYRQQKPKAKRYQSEIGINGLFRDVCNCMAVGHPPVECLNIAMERGWQTPSPDYFKPEMFTKLTNGTVQETKEQILKRHGLSA